MAKLILSMDDQVLKEMTLSKERTTIGRKPHNDIQIDNLAVSGEHAVIVSIMNDCFLEDLQSTNGTQVNGKAVKKHFLQNNDVIELGKYKLKFVQDAAPKPAAAPVVDKADFEKTMVLRPGAMRAAVEQAKAMASGAQAGGAAEAARAAAVKQAAATAAATGTADKDAKPAAAPATGTADKDAKPAAAPAAPATPPLAPAEPARTPPAAPAPQPAPAAAPKAPPAPAPAAAAPKPLIGAIQLLSGANAGKELELAKPLTTLGRPGVQVAVLTRRPLGYFITHVEGAQHPAVNGQAIGTAPHALKDHDVIELAGVKMEFFLKG
jgi:pSer/pThr/pTyr-binding forkhead associated (FHA) protein